MVIEREYFTVELTSEIDLGIALADMNTVVQFEAKNICAVPGVADFWYGVVNFKGALLWILDSDRFFDVATKYQQSSPKLTAIIVRNRLADGQQVAIVTSQLKGIVEIEPTEIKSLMDDHTSKLHECCSAVVHTQAKAIYLIDSATLLQQLHQQSILVTT
jgi:twitching motility protein PilI